MPKWSIVTLIAVNKKWVGNNVPQEYNNRVSPLGTNTFIASELDLRKPDIASG